ncbi:MAG: hypothetical protein ACJ790_13215 [Myxococcaceae bacterium]
MRKLLLVPIVAVLACSAGRYSRNDLQLVTSYTAKEMCACLWTMEQDETFCRAWTKAKPEVAKMRIDVEKKTVTAEAITLWGAKAHWVSDRAGCVLDQ